jgi:hypothetical protein
MTMHRRDLFKGLAATLVAINIPLPLEQLIAAPQSQVMTYLTRTKLDILHKLTHPPIVVNRFGVITYSAEDPTISKNLHLALDHINRLMTELA